MKIVDVLTAKGMTGFYFDDQRAIKAGAVMDGFTYVGEPQTLHFSAIRQAGEALSIMLVLEGNLIASGDCAAVQYSGASGRDPLFLAATYEPLVHEHLKPRLIGLDVRDFLAHARHFDTLKIEGKRLHSALRYGLSQALLDACALAHRVPVAHMVRTLYKLSHDRYDAIPIFAQSGDERMLNVDKMIIKEADVLPHALINNIDTKLGRQGELLLTYVAWLKERIETKRLRDDYAPILHIDVYGTIGIIFEEDTKRMSQYLSTLAKACHPLTLRIEGPVDCGSQDGTIKALKALKKQLKDDGVPVEIVADEWCNTFEDVKLFIKHDCADMIQVKTPDLGSVHNTIEALLYCQAHGVGAYSGGTCNETNLSAQITTSIAIATNATQVLAKPGMGTDEGIMIVKNHMARELALLRRLSS